MTQNLDEIRGSISRDIAPEWLDLSATVRRRTEDLQVRARGGELEAETAALAVEVRKLCNHMDALHSDVISLFTRLDGSPVDQLFEREESEEIQAESVKIEREMHEWKEDPKENVRDVIKALFMWRDDPAERIREKTKEP